MRLYRMQNPRLELRIILLFNFNFFATLDFVILMRKFNSFFAAVTKCIFLAAITVAFVSATYSNQDNQYESPVNLQRSQPRTLTPGQFQQQSQFSQGNIQQGQAGPGNFQQVPTGPGNFQQQSQFNERNLQQSQPGQGNFQQGNFQQQGQFGTRRNLQQGPGNLKRGNARQGAFQLSQNGLGNLQQQGQFGPGNFQQGGQQNLQQGPSSFLQRQSAPGNFQQAQIPGNLQQQNLNRVPVRSPHKPQQTRQKNYYGK